MIIINSSVDALGILILKIRGKNFFLKQVLYFSLRTWDSCLKVINVTVATASETLPQIHFPSEMLWMKLKCWIMKPMVRPAVPPTILEDWLHYRNPSRLSGSWSQNRLAGYHVIFRSSQSLPLSLVRPVSHPKPVLYLPPAYQSIMIYFNANYRWAPDA